MNNTTNNGRLIHSWKYLDTENEIYGVTKAKFKGEYSYLHDYMGDHSECWIIEKDIAGKETRRISTRAIEFIIWEGDVE